MPVNRNLIKFGSATHLFWYQVSGGIIGGRMFGMPVLLLTTTGRKSGRKRTIPLMCVPDGDAYGVIASNGGNPKNPAWYHNLLAHPEAEMQIGRERKRVRAEEASEAERERIWSQATQAYSGYEQYQQETKRKIPVLILRPA
jgi:deazaflavin-dependent oxidoreductase (nitroreductase family)